MRRYDTRLKGGTLRSCRAVRVRRRLGGNDSTDEAVASSSWHARTSTQPAIMHGLKDVATERLNEYRSAAQPPLKRHQTTCLFCLALRTPHSG